MNDLRAFPRLICRSPVTLTGTSWVADLGMIAEPGDAVFRMTVGDHEQSLLVDGAGVFRVREMTFTLHEKTLNVTLGVTEQRSSTSLISAGSGSEWIGVLYRGAEELVHATTEALRSKAVQVHAIAVARWMQLESWKTSMADRRFQKRMEDLTAVHQQLANRKCHRHTTIQRDDVQGEVEVLALGHIAKEELLKTLGDRERAMLVLRARGFTWEAIADRLKAPLRTIERAASRLRKELQGPV